MPVRELILERVGGDSTAGQYREDMEAAADLRVYACMSACAIKFGLRWVGQGTSTMIPVTSGKVATPLPLTKSEKSAESVNLQRVCA